MNMDALLELIFSFLQNFFASDNSNSVVDVTPRESDDKPVILSTSPSSDGEPKKPKGDAEICKVLTDQVIEIHKSARFVPVTTIEEIDNDKRKHMAGALGVKLPILGDKFISGCISFPAPAPAPDTPAPDKK